MSIKVKLYGDLREKVPNQGHNNGAPSILNIEDGEINTVFDILNKFSIEENEVSHIFVNFKYCGAGKSVKDGDQIGIFPRKMALMFVEINKNNIVSVTVKLFADLQQYGPAKSTLDMPEGSTINSIIEKYRIPKDKKIIMLVNGLPRYDKNFVLNNDDVLSIFPPLAGG
ncbi:MAG: MoaD/ThiS family protein [Promethearchaeota archaeon]